jgi:hypothetical protein
LLIERNKEPPLGTRVLDRLKAKAKEQT